jgi:peptidoglycan/LPS O-acetylase OafA/YrhL
MPAALKTANQVNLRYYFLRRLFRIYPVMICAMLLGVWSVAATSQVPEGAAGTFISNIFLTHGVIPDAPPIGNEILGTVIVECLLYAIYPVGLFFVRKMSWLHVLAAVAMIHLINLLFLGVAGIEPSWIQRNVFALLLYWWIGAFSAQCAFGLRQRHMPGRLLALGYILYIVISHALQFKGSHFIKSGFLALLAGGFLGYLVRWEDRRWNRSEKSPLSRIFVYLGEQSYSLYVVHLPVLTILTPLLFGSGPTGSIPYVTSFMAVLILSGVFYAAIEKPSQELGVKVSSRYIGH